MSAIRTAARPEPSAVLTKATLRAAEALGLTLAELARIIGISAASASRLGRTRNIDPRTKEGELAALFLRLYRSVDSLLGGNVGAAKAWFQAKNEHLGATPADLVQRVEGLARVVAYLDAMRAKS
jgi:hypothetical protein